MIYWTADTHFAHFNIIKYCRRPFYGTRHMDRTMICRWNETVTPEDVVYHCGDFALCSEKQLYWYLSQLNGQIYIVRGNHDKSATKLRRAGFRDVYKRLELPNIIARHRPDDFEETDRAQWLLCGHVHGHWRAKKIFNIGGRRVVNVGVDQWDFRPVTLEQIARRLWAHDQANSV